MGERVLVTSAGIGGSNNLVRSLNAGDPSLEVAGCHDDRFFLKKSLADPKYLIPPLASPEGGRALRRLVGRERIELVIPTSDDDVATLSRLRAGFGRRLFLPRASVIAICQDKYRLNAFLTARGVPVPITRPLTGLGDVERAFRQVAVDARAWCRIRSGSGSLGAIAVESPAQARDWIRYWRDMRGARPSTFILSEFLPGRDLGCQSLWKDGALILIKTYERLSYLATGSQPTDISSVAGLAKTVVDRRVVEICARAVRALDPRASGVFSIDLRENGRGVPCITEINAGRFTSATPIFDLTGQHNMAATFVRLAVGSLVELREVYDVAPDYYMLRDLDTPPRIFHADDFFDGIQEAAVITDRRSEGRRHGQLSSHGKTQQQAASARVRAPVQQPGSEEARASLQSRTERPPAQVPAAGQGSEGARQEAHGRREAGSIPIVAPAGLDARLLEAFWLELRRLAARHGADVTERAASQSRVPASSQNRMSIAR